MSEAKIVLSAEDRTRAAFESVKSNLGAIQTKAVAVTGALGALGVTAYVADMAMGIKRAIAEWDELGKAAQRVGFQSAQSMAEYQFAAKLAGVETAGLETAVGKLSSKMADAGGGNKEAAALFRALRVEVKDASGQLRDTENVLSDLAARFAQFKDSPEKTALALELFGKSGKELIPLLNGGAQGLEKMREEFRQLRGVLDGGATKAAEQFNDNITKLEASAGSLKRELSEKMLPGLVQITDAMVEQAKKGNVLIAVYSGLAEFAKMAFKQDTIGKATTSAEDIATRLKGKGAELELLQESLKIGGDDKQGSLQKKINSVRAELEALQKAALAATQALKTTLNPGFENDPSYQGLEDRRLAGKKAPVLDRKDKPSAAPESAYAAVNRAVSERLALASQELTLGRELTDVEKFEAKAMEDLRLSKVKVTAAQTADIEAKIRGLKTDELQVKSQRAQSEIEKQLLAQRQQQRKTDYEQSAAALRDIEAARQKSLKSVTDRISAQTDENEATLLAAQLNVSLAEAIELVTIKRLEERRAERAVDGGEEYEALTKEIEARKELLGLLHSKADFDKGREMWESLDRTAHDVWTNIFEGGTNLWKKLKDTAKAMFFDWLYQVAARPILLQATMAVTGTPASTAMQALGGGASPLGGMGSLGGLGNIGSSVQGLLMPGGVLNGLANGASALGFGNFAAGLSGAGGSFASSVGAGLATDAMGATVVEGAAAATLGSTGAAAGAGLAAAIPVIGWAVAAAAVLYSIFGKKGGGPKQDGTFGVLNSGIGLGDHTSGSDSAARAAAQGLQSQYDAIVKAYSGTGGLQFGLGFSTDPAGKSPTFLDVTASRNGQAAFSEFNGNVGRSQEELQAAIGEMGARAMLRGLQEANLEGQIGEFLRGLGDAATLAADKVTASIARVQKAGTEKAALEEQIYQLTHNDLEKFARARQQELDAVDESNRALAERVHALQDERQAAATLGEALGRAKDSAKSYSDFIGSVNTNIRGYIDRLNGTPAGMLPPEQQLANAKLQFNEQLGLARAGDRTALQGITGYADQLISAQTAYTASGGGTASAIASIKAALAGLPQMESGEEYLARVIRETSGEQVAATQGVGAKVWDGLWGSAGLLAEQFSAFDTNASGGLSFEELQAALGPLAADATIREFIAKVDTNNDGQISQLEAIKAGVYASTVEQVSAASTQTAAVVEAINAKPKEVVVLWGGTQFASEAEFRSFIDTQTVSGFASGGLPPVGEDVWVGERGPERVRFMQPVRVFSAEESRTMSRSGGDDTALLKQMKALGEKVDRLTAVAAQGARGTIEAVGEVADNTAVSARNARLAAARAPA